VPTGLDIAIALSFIALAVAEAALTSSVVSPLQHLLVAFISTRLRPHECGL
jgi:hypothetical protein